MDEVRKKKYRGGLKRKKGYLLRFNEEEYKTIIDKTERQGKTIAEFMRLAIEKEITKQP